MKAIFCDICGTLFYSNTTFDFIDYVNNSKKYQFVKKVFLNYLARKSNAVLYHLFGIDLLKRVFISFLKDLSKDELLLKANEFYANYLNLHKIEDTFSIINEYRSKGYRLYLVSATLDVIAEKVGKELNADGVISSPLCYDSQLICKGKIKVDLLGRKFEYVRKNKYYTGNMLVITDDYSDLELVKHAQIVYIVTKEKNKHRWKSFLRNISNPIFIIK